MPKSALFAFDVAGMVRSFDYAAELTRRDHLGATGDTDHTDRLAEIDAPTLVVVGDQDIVTPPERSQALAAGIPNAQLATIADAGHLANQQRPDAFNAVVADFLGDGNMG